MKLNRSSLAFIVAPLTPAVIIAAGVQMEKKTFFLSVLLALLVSYIACFIFGALIIRFLKRKKVLNVLYLTMSGALVGGVVFYLFGFLMAFLLDSSNVFMIRKVLSGGAFGFSAALVFGLIAGYPVFKDKERL